MSNHSKFSCLRPRQLFVLQVQLKSSSHSSSLGEIPPFTLGALKGQCLIVHQLCDPASRDAKEDSDDSNESAS